MRTKLVLTLLAVGTFWCASTVSAGEIYGKIRVGNQSIGPNVTVVIKHHSTSKDYSANTDKYGRFSIFVPGTGRCTLKILGGENPLEISVNSYKTSSECNLTVYRERKSGRLKLRRD